MFLIIPFLHNSHVFSVFFFFRLHFSPIIVATTIILRHTLQIQGKQIPPGLCSNVKSNTKKSPCMTPSSSSSFLHSSPLIPPLHKLSPSSSSSVPRLFPFPNPLFAFYIINAPSLSFPIHSLLHIETLSSPLTFKTSLPGCCLLPTPPIRSTRQKCAPTSQSLLPVWVSSSHRQTNLLGRLGWCQADGVGLLAANGKGACFPLEGGSNL